MAENTQDDDSEEQADSISEAFLPLVPTELGIDPILLALLQTAAFLDLSDDDSVDPEFAGDVLERVGLYVQRLPAERVPELQSQLGRLHAHAVEAGWPPDLSEFVGQFLYNCGLGDEDDVAKDPA